MIAKKLRNEGGFIFIILGVGVLIALCGFAALALDVSRAYIVKNQLQNAADASALAGAGNLYNTATIPPTLVWANGEQAAKDFIAKNSADGKALTDCTVETGYWNVKLPSTQTLQAKTIQPGVCSVSGSACSSDAQCNAGMDACIFVNVPAVRVTVNKGPDVNGGPVRTFFAKVLGWNDFQPGASGLALAGFPGSTPPGGAYPFAVTECLKDDFLNKTGPIFGDGLNHDVVLTSTIATSEGNMLAGQWTNLLTDGTNTNANTVKGYIQYLADATDKQGSPGPAVKTGDAINVAAGVMTANYTETNKFIAKTGGTVYMPVVQCGMDPTAPPTTMVVKGFAEMQLVCANCPHNGDLTARFIAFHQAPPGAGPGGVVSNTVIPPKMAQ